MSVFLDRGSLIALYDALGPGVFNLCLRTTGSREPAAMATQGAFLCVLGLPHRRDTTDTDVSACLLATARHAGKLVGHAGEPATGPASPVEAANRRLALAHREVLALRDMIGCSYDEIAAIIDADARAPAELLWRARLELRDRLQGSRLISIAAVAEPCRRVLPLIAMRLDGELRDAEQGMQLRAHLRTCGKCRVSQEAMRDADAAYRAWPREPPPPGLGELLHFIVDEDCVSGRAAKPAA
jgi:DNA-directed RNA polymerase specialized sigma24 family protein